MCVCVYMHNAHALIVPPCDDLSATYIVLHVLLLFGIYRLKLHLGKLRPKNADDRD